MLAAGARREHVVVALVELIDCAFARGVEVREFALKHEGADDEVMVRMHVVAAARAVKRLVAEHAHGAEARSAALVVMEIETGFALDERAGYPAM